MITIPATTMIQASDMLNVFGGKGACWPKITLSAAYPDGFRTIGNVLDIPVGTIYGDPGPDQRVSDLFSVFWTVFRSQVIGFPCMYEILSKKLHTIPNRDPRSNKMLTHLDGTQAPGSVIAADRKGASDAQFEYADSRMGAAFYLAADSLVESKIGTDDSERLANEASFTCCRMIAMSLGGVQSGKYEFSPEEDAQYQWFIDEIKSRLI